MGNTDQTFLGPFAFPGDRWVALVWMGLLMWDCGISRRNKPQEEVGKTHLKDLDEI